MLLMIKNQLLSQKKMKKLNKNNKCFPMISHKLNKKKNFDDSAKLQSKSVSSQEDKQLCQKPATVGGGRCCRVKGGGLRRRGVRRRGGNQSRPTASLSQLKAVEEAEKKRKESAEEHFCKRDDYPLTIPSFTGESKINVVIGDGTKYLDTASFFQDDEFYSPKPNFVPISTAQSIQWFPAIQEQDFGRM